MLFLLALAPGSAGAAEDSRAAYVGAEACRPCHAEIYRGWRATLHGRSVLSAEEARDAGFPLPSRRGGGRPLSIQSWDDVGYVFGGRHRIAYADRDGQIQDTAYHRRAGEWRSFPTKEVTVCGACHATGHGAATSVSETTGLSLPFADWNIGCEACHGPGGRHVETFDFEDIVVDASSGLCGTCHTAVGRVLPEDDRHRTHDSVQTWEDDPHVTGVRRHSHNAFCSGCHAPYDGSVLGPDAASRRRVFSEDKQNITCIGCHDPHAPTRHQVYEGNDRDFTTSDFEVFATGEEVCVACHRGADRIVLDHADASCIDCHNTFWRNRSLESRLFHDANRSALNCRPCHADADHLMTLLYQDPDFLEPEIVHDLRTLPAEVVERYGFGYPSLKHSRDAGRTDDGQTAAPDPAPTAADPDVRPASSLLHGLLASDPHSRLAEDDEVRALQQALLAAPDRLAPHVELALAYGDREAHGESWDVLRLAADSQAGWVLLDLPLDDEAGTEGVGEAGIEGAGEAGAGGAGATNRILERLPPATSAPDSESLRLWLRGYFEMTRGRFVAAAEIFAEGRAREPDQTRWRFHEGLAALGGQRYESAGEHLLQALALAPEHPGARVALASVHLKKARFAQARSELETATAQRPGDAVAHYLLGRAYLVQGDEERAVDSLRSSLRAAPGFLDGWFALAQAYRASGTPDAAVEAYREIIRQRPNHFDAHLQLAKLYKRLSDRLIFRLRGDEESAPPPGTSAHDWHGHLRGLGDGAAEFRRLALEEFSLALSLGSSNEALRQVGEIQRRAGRLKDADSIFRWLADRAPGQWIYLYRLGTIAIELGNIEAAIETLERASAMAPQEGDPYLALGLAYARAGRTDEAIETFRRATIHEPFNPALYTNLGAALAIRGELAPARTALRRSLELSTFPLPRRHLAHTNLALVSLKEGRRDEAARALKQALHVYPGYEPAGRLLDAIRSGNAATLAETAAETGFLFNGHLEIFGEVTTVAFDHE